MPAGRPTKYTKKLAEEICVRLSGGESLRAICRDQAMPNKATVMRWLQADRPGFREMYELALEARAEGLADEIIDIADEADKDTAHAVKVRVDARKWVAARLLPKKYGDVRRHEHSGEVSLNLSDVIDRLNARGQGRDG